MLEDLRVELKARRFNPAPVREKMIPKANGKLRRLGIPTAADRVVQAALKLVLEPIFEADFHPASYGFRPRRRAQDAIAEIFYLGSPTRNYLWVFEADIEACFDEIDHTALMDRIRSRIGDKRVLALLKAFLRAGILSEDTVRRDTTTGTPQGGILTPPTKWQNAPIDGIEASHKRVRRNAEDDVHVGLVDFHPADERANNLTACEPVGGFQTVLHLGAKVLESSYQ
jgi:group II intron reverse transcriptase/maturase